MTTTMPEGLLPRLGLMADATVHQRMVAILGSLPAIGKSQRNEQQKFMYRGHDDVLNALNPLLAEYGVFMVPEVLERKTAQRTTKSGSIMYEVNLLVQYTFYGANGDSIVASAWGEGTDSGDKATNKAMTMAMKNVIAQAFAVSTEENQRLDTDGNTDEETFDPGKHTLPDAIKGEGAAKRVADGLTALDPTIDWTGTLQPLIRAVFGVESRQEIPTGRTAEFWRRLSNALARMGDVGLFPTPGDEAILGALAWAFQGADTIIVLNEGVAEAEAVIAAETATAADSDPDIPFGGDDATPLDDEPGS